MLKTYANTIGVKECPEQKEWKKPRNKKFVTNSDLAGILQVKDAWGINTIKPETKAMLDDVWNDLPKKTIFSLVEEEKL